MIPLAFVGAVVLSAVIMSGVGLALSKRHTSPGLLMSTHGAVCLASMLFFNLGITLTFQAVANAASDIKQEVLWNGIWVSSQPVLLGLGGAAVIATIHWVSLRRSQTAGIPIKTTPNAVCWALAALPVVSSLVAQTYAFFRFMTATASQSAASFFTATGVHLVGLGASAVLAVGAVLAGIVLKRRKNRESERP